MTFIPGGNFVRNNHIHHFGQWMKTHQYAITIAGVGNYISNNRCRGKGAVKMLEV